MAGLSKAFWDGAERIALSAWRIPSCAGWVTARSRRSVRPVHRAGRLLSRRVRERFRGRRAAAPTRLDGGCSTSFAGVFQELKHAQSPELGLDLAKGSRWRRSYKISCSPTR
jgi:hypothetical protein